MGADNKATIPVLDDLIETRKAGASSPTIAPTPAVDEGNARPPM